MTVIGVLLGGTARGGEYALVVLGFVLTWYATRVVNLAQGAIAVAGTYVAWQLRTAFGAPPLLALIAAALLMLTLGYTAGYVSIPMLRDRPSFLVLVVTFGAGLSLQGLLQLRRGSQHRTLSHALASANAAGNTAADIRAAAVIACCGGCCTVGIAVWRSGLGRVMSAVGGDRQTARTLGIRPQRIEALAVGLGAAYAVIGAGLAGLTSVFRPADASRYTLVCAVIAIAVGVGSPVRAVVAATAFGVADALARYLLGNGQTAVAAIILLLIVLVARSAGVLHDGGVSGEREEPTR